MTETQLYLASRARTEDLIYLHFYLNQIRIKEDDYIVILITDTKRCDKTYYIKEFIILVLILIHIQKNISALQNIYLNNIFKLQWSIFFRHLRKKTHDVLQKICINHILVICRNRSLVLQSPFVLFYRTVFPDF